MKYVWRVQTLERRVVAKCLEEMKTKSKEIGSDSC